MGDFLQRPHRGGQLIWCPSDPSLGIGLVTAIDGTVVRVRFLRLQVDRAYTTRSNDFVLARYNVVAGERVRHVDGRSLVVQRRLPDSQDGLAVYAIQDGNDLETVVESELVPEVRDVGAKERLETLNLVHPEVVRARYGGLRLANFGARAGHSAVLGARVQWLAHQIDVATRAVAVDPVRLLLADEVGLGKTVEAAMIFAGLRQEGRASRVLVLTPESLCIQWLGELYRKVHELLVLLDRARLEDALADFPGLNSFEAHQRIVASLERIAEDDSLAEQAAVAPWDLVIVDEAHHLRWNAERGGNRAYRLVDALARNTRHLLLLTATPMALDPAEYHALLRLLAPARFDDPGAFEGARTRAASIRQVGRELTQAMEAGRAVDPQTQEQAEALLRDDGEDLIELHSLLQMPPDAPARLDVAGRVFEALRHRHGLADYVVRNRRGPVGGLPQRQAEVSYLQPTETQDVLLEVGESIAFELARSLPDDHARNEALGRMLRALWATPAAIIDIVALYYNNSPELVKDLQPHIAAVIDAPIDGAGLPTGDARLRWLTKQVRELEPGDKLLVFVESPIAVRALRQSLESALGYPLAVFHRELSPRDQDRQVAWFRDPRGPQVMLSTEAGGEGRNFQFCHQVVLYDLPWRPATVEQRIGRVDRVGQRHDVRVLVPCFRVGYEAAVLKVMQESIGVLDGTVGGIDHGLEYVSDQIAELILSEAEAPAWHDLFARTRELVTEARHRVAAGIDPILDHASFSETRALQILAGVPSDLESRTESFVQRYAGHSKIKLHSKAPGVYAVEGGPSSAGHEHGESGFVATFSRIHALDHEEVEFLSFGHPLVEQALEWARHDSEASAALALCRNFSSDGAVFLWCYTLDLPDDAPAAGAYFGRSIFVFAVDEEGKRVPEFDDLLAWERPLERMDATALRPNIVRWQKLVERTHAAADAAASEASEVLQAKARAKLAEVIEQGERDLRRAQARERAVAAGVAGGAAGVAAAPAALSREHEAAALALASEHGRLGKAIDHSRLRLFASVAVRLMRTKHVSA